MTSLAGTRASSPARPKGRPPEADGQETRRAILRAARHSFGRVGYERTTFKLLADEVGITVGAFYNYFPSKREIFIAADRDSQDAVFPDILARIDAAEGVVEKLCAFLDGALAVFEDDPQLANFIAFTRLEARRHDELAPVLQDRRWEDLWSGIVDDAIAAGEVSPGDERAVRGVIAAAVFGLSQLASESTPAQHAEHIRGFQAMLRGELFNVSTDR